jgi:hypothetical protein
MADDLAAERAAVAELEQLVRRRRELTAEWIELEGIVRSGSCPHCGRRLSDDARELAAMVAQGTGVAHG